MTEPIGLAFANAVLGSAPDLGRWLETGAGLDAATSEEVSLRLPDFAGLQAALRDVLSGSIVGVPPAAAVERLNEASARVPRVLRLRPPEREEAPLGSSPTALVLARVAWSAIDVVGGPDRERLRCCPACGRFFLATRSDRMWCSVACGNRIRVARFHAARRVSGRGDGRGPRSSDPSRMTD